MCASIRMIKSGFVRPMSLSVTTNQLWRIILGFLFQNFVRVICIRADAKDLVVLFPCSCLDDLCGIHLLALLVALAASEDKNGSETYLAVRTRDKLQSALQAVPRQVILQFDIERILQLIHIYASGNQSKEINRYLVKTSLCKSKSG